MKRRKTDQIDKEKSLLSLRYYWSIVKQYPLYLWGVAITIPITIVINSFIPPLIIAHAIERLSRGMHTSNELWSTFGGQIVLYSCVALLGIITWRFVDYFVWRLELRVQQNIAEDVFTHLLKHSATFHANHFGGSLVSQSNKLISSYSRIADTTIFQVYPMVISILATIVLLLPKAPYFVLGLIALSCIYIVVALKISRPIRRIATKWAAAESKQTGMLADAITNVTTIKSYARGEEESARFHDATIKTRTQAFRFAHLHQLQMNAFGIIGRTIAAGSFVLAVISVVVFKQDVGTVFLIVSYTSVITEHLFRFGNDSMRAYNRGFGDAYDMSKILSEKPEVVDVDEPQELRTSDGGVIFDKVTFTHDGAEKPIFDTLSIAIKPGEKVGLVGHSGSGKTTFTRLLMRFSDIDDGKICLDGQNIAAISQDDLHRSIAYVPQEPLLFHRSLAENIGYGKVGATADDIKRAAVMATAAEFIAGLPEGYETLVGERGVKLSGGQRQRIAIARAMLKDAPILVLDEATSALDSESEALIQKALWKLMEGRTTIAIAHRLSTIQHMDRIIVLDNGRIVEDGTHRELLDRGGTYAKLWARQSGGFIED